MIEVESLTKTFRDRRRGGVHALEGVCFQCRPGEVYGLLGPNGAGKTTTLRIISTALRPTAGTARVMGHDVTAEARDVRRRIGFLSANTGLYGRLTPREVLAYFGRLHGMARPAIRARIEEANELFDLGEFLDRPCDKLSTGMKQRVNIARAVFHHPPVMVFDEPTTGLDVLSSHTIVRFIARCRAEGRTVVFSTHIMTEVQRLCDRVGIIHKGRMHFDGTLEELHARHGSDTAAAFLAAIGEEA